MAVTRSDTGTPNQMFRYPAVAVTVLAAAVAGSLAVSGHVAAANDLLGLFALSAAAIMAARMFQALLHGHLGIDVLAIIAIVATVLVGQQWAGLIIVMMMAGGKALEDYASARARRDLAGLLAREPKTAHLVDPATGEICDIAIDEIRTGQQVLVRAQETVPVDGRLTSDPASFDQSSITGESLPVDKDIGDLVLSGSVNGTGSVTLAVTAVAADSQLQSIISLVRDAEEHRAPVVRLADRFAIPFTALSLALAGAAWWLSGEASRFAEVLVLATPCPLLLAAPVAFMGGMSRAARSGIIVKGGSVLEVLSRVRTVVLDKTGTLTRGTPTVSGIYPVGPWEERELLGLVASAESHSSHVLAGSIVAEAGRRDVPLQKVDSSREEAAQGIVATIADRCVAVGTFAFITGLAPGFERRNLTGGEVAVYVAVDGRYAGNFILIDEIRSNAIGVIDSLHDRGIAEVVMLTGDAHDTAAHVAAALGIRDFRANCLPEDKVDEVQRIARRPVLMVGDGVNDAPVLASAEVGIALGGRGATIAGETASAVVLVDDLSRIVVALDIGRATVRIALQSIWIGMLLSVVLMVVAMFGVIPAAAGAATQELVDLITILNAMRAVRSRAEKAVQPPRWPAPAKADHVVRG